jgi:ATP-dependent DNA ligase
LELNFAERGVTDCILDGEIVYVDEDNNFLAFQDIERKEESMVTQLKE